MSLDPKEVKEVVVSTLREFMAELNRGQSSTEIEKSASGKVAFKVKVYGDDPTANTNTARHLAAALAKEHGVEGFPPANEDFTAPTPSPTNDPADTSSGF